MLHLHVSFEIRYQNATFSSCMSGTLSNRFSNPVGPHKTVHPLRKRTAGATVPRAGTGKAFASPMTSSGGGMDSIWSRARMTGSSMHRPPGCELQIASVHREDFRGLNVKLVDLLAVLGDVVNCLTTRDDLARH
jgi:hypothetical protein